MLLILLPWIRAQAVSLKYPAAFWSKEQIQRYDIPQLVAGGGNLGIVDVNKCRIRMANMLLFACLIFLG